MKLWIISVLACVVFVTEASAQGTRPASGPVAWGEAREGLSVSIAREGEGMKVRCAIRNEGLAAVQVGEGFAWVLAARSREQAWYSRKIALGGLFAKEVGSGQTAEAVIDLSEVEAYAMQKGLRIVEGYPKGDAEPRAEAKLAEVIEGGTVRLRVSVVLPGVGEAIASNLLTVQGREALAAELVEQFKADAFSAKAAHDRAVKSGAAVLPDLIAAMRDADNPSFARMWLATAVIDLRDPSVVDELMKLIDDGDGSVRAVVAYHGAKLKSEKLNAAVARRAKTDGLIAAWGARGLMAFGGAVSDEMIDAAYASPEPRARAEVAPVLATRGEKGIERLVALLADEHELVRVAAAKAVTEGNVRSAKAVGALVAALDRPGDAARASVTEALAKLTGKTWTYDPQAKAEEKRKVVEQWKAWWQGAEKGFK